MTKLKLKPKLENDSSIFNDSKIISDITRIDIQKSINLKDTNTTEAYYSNRYGWTLRKIIY